MFNVIKSAPGVYAELTILFLPEIQIRISIRRIRACFTRYANYVWLNHHDKLNVPCDVDVGDFSPSLFGSSEEIRNFLFNSTSSASLHSPAKKGVSMNLNM